MRIFDTHGQITAMVMVGSIIITAIVTQGTIEVEKIKAGILGG